MVVEFVPGGLAEGSQAVHCLDPVVKNARPEGYGMIWALRYVHAQDDVGQSQTDSHRLYETRHFCVHPRQ